MYKEVIETSKELAWFESKEGLLRTMNMNIMIIIIIINKINTISVLKYIGFYSIKLQHLNRLILTNLNINTNLFLKLFLFILSIYLIKMSYNYLSYLSNLIKEEIGAPPSENFEWWKYSYSLKKFMTSYIHIMTSCVQKVIIFT